MSLVHGCSALACDKIRVADTLLAVNDVSVQGMNFRDPRAAEQILHVID
jgi:hypothetical protein